MNEWMNEWMNVAVCACIDLQSYKAQSLPQKDLFYLKEKVDPDRAKTAHSNTPPTCLRHDVEIFA